MYSSRADNDIYDNGYSIFTRSKADENESKYVNQIRNVSYESTLNKRSHGTDRYEIADLVVRRGLHFQIVLELDRPYDERRDDIVLKFEIDGKDEKDKKVIQMNLSGDRYRHDWALRISRQQSQYIALQIFTPPTCIVGRWKLSVSSFLRTKIRTAEYRYRDKTMIYMLFNPWCKDDLVYFPSRHLAYFYVMDEDALICKGTKDDRNNDTPWVFGQFEEDVLECAMYLLEKSNLKLTDRGDPVKVGRTLSAVASAPDNNGVLVGNWSGNYSDGVAPWTWTGSAEILSKYYKTKTPVKYGQCWVFSGILTTLCRTLGIPARSVTCFDSAHDTDGNTTIDKFVDHAGKHTGEDSIWNFHVWNDIWTKRPDYGSQFDGWQALDGTPQEKSNGIYRCGPAPLYAVKSKTDIPFDTKFVYAEVNGDIVVRDKRTDEIISVDSDTVGSKILTAYPSDERKFQDITNEYKNPERSTTGSRVENPPGSELNKRLKIEFVNKHSMFGDTFQTALKVMNNTGGKRTLQGIITISSITPTGKPGYLITERKINVPINYGTEKEFPISVEVEQYMDKLLEECFLKVEGLFYIPETQRRYPVKNLFMLNKPKLAMTAPRTAPQNSQFVLELSFRNPLNCMLTGCEVTIESAKLFRAGHFRVRDVAPREVFRMPLEIRTRGPNPEPYKISASFNSRELFEVRGLCRVQVQRY